MSNGLTYTFLRGGPIDHFQRRVGNQVLSYVTHTDAELVMFDFGRLPGDTLASHAYPWDTLDVIFYESSVVTLFGLPRRQWLFGFIWRHVPDWARIYTVTDSIGVTKREEFWGTYTLIGARVNGRTYGDITSTPTTSGNFPLVPVLYQNYPNPFNPTSAISFFLPQRVNAMLEVYNMLGQSVASLCDGVLESGLHEIEFDGSHLGSGVYFYRLRTDLVVRTKTMVIQK